MGSLFEYVILVSKYNRETVWTRYTSLITPHRMVKRFLCELNESTAALLIDVITIRGWVNASINSQKETGTCRRLNTRCPDKDTWNPRRAAVYCREESEDTHWSASLPPRGLPPLSPARGCSFPGPLLPRPEIAPSPGLSSPLSLARGYSDSGPSAWFTRPHRLNLSSAGKPLQGRELKEGIQAEGLINFKVIN